MKRQKKIVTTPADPMRQPEYLAPIYVTRDGVTKYPVILIERQVFDLAMPASELASVNVSATPENDKTDETFSVSLTAMKTNGAAAALVTGASVWAGTWRLA